MRIFRFTRTWILLFALVILCVSSCQKVTCSYLEIQNSSKDWFYVDLFYHTVKIPNDRATIRVRQGASTPIWIDCDKGDVLFPSLADIGIDSLHIVLSDVYEIQLNSTTAVTNSPFSKENWRQEDSKRPGGGTYSSLIFEITDADILNWQNQ